MRALTLSVLLLASALLALLEVLLQPTYAGSVPVPLGVLLVLVTLPFLVYGAADVSTSALAVSSPVVVWGIVTVVFGIGGPGGDVLLPITWQTLVLLVVGLLTGLVSVRRVLDRELSDGELSDRELSDSGEPAERG